ncbi:hypothetical protein SAMN04488134_101608 [Amphibacillus marinus]|uniref:Cof subfamily of IIB subfamily of haloacid dehalogenase superfamily/HAD-superfamily hydrolase, subfamily IIB n=1 Tax=Amphibacillus marinus TaxID=872970 RepID=A0A1H8IGN1_9BACI|nr:Cof-type HAD-IIB family hydrolase [Amphibacillus marinus]SEN67386.1 hypothetical protein SAMN04488134_101608 [Amphibacillus marinus]
MNKKSVIFFDIDGTLLNEQKQMPQSTKAAIEQLKSDGHLVAIATGRAPFMYEQIREELGINTYVSYNGSYVVLEGKVIFTNPLNKDALLAMTKEGLENDHPIVYMDEHDMRANVPDHAYINESIESLKVGRFPTHDPDYHQGRDLYQSLFFCTEGEEEHYRQRYDSFTFVRWHPLSVDILPKGGSKAHGIKQVINALAISEENVYAFGDGLNDVEMLTTVKNSVAMDNGHQAAKEAAKLVTKSVDDDGIYHGLKQLGLIK